MKWYELAPISKRSAKKLARTYGYDSPQTLADGIPPDALVFDVGSGDSKFGHTIAAMRPDIHWVNVDLKHGRTRRSKRNQARAPQNVKYIGANVLQLPFVRHSAQQVFSNAMITYLGVDSSDYVRRSYEGMVDLLASDGEIAINGLSNTRNGAFHATAEQLEFYGDDILQSVVTHYSLTPKERTAVKVILVLSNIT